MAEEQDDSVSELLGREAAPIVIEHAGRKYKARNLHEGPLSKWERIVRAEYRAQCLETTGNSARADDMTARAGVTRQFRWGSELSCAFLTTADGGVAFASLVFACGVEEIKELSKDHGSELKAALEQVIAESFPDRPKDDDGEEPVPNGRSAAHAST
jgi:hypothetical protein